MRMLRATTVAKGKSPIVECDALHYKNLDSYKGQILNPTDVFIAGMTVLISNSPQDMQVAFQWIALFGSGKEIIIAGISEP